jgi:probable F420-dependent oxidoreductase
VELPPIGIWDRFLRFADEGEIRDSAAELVELGYGALWIPDIGGDIVGAVDLLLGATTHIEVGTSILNLWLHAAAETAAGWAALTGRHGRRPVLGVGVSHAPFVDAVAPGQYKAPLERTAAWLDDLDATQPTVGPDDRLLAALRPRMLELARDRCGGAYPYHMPPEHTERARAALGPDRALAVEQCVVLTTDLEAGRAAARESLAIYLVLPNYLNAWRWVGFSDDDLAEGGSDRFVDAIVAIGDDTAIRRRVQAHLDAGADHVGVQVVGSDLAALRPDWRTLAPALLNWPRG